MPSAQGVAPARDDHTADQNQDHAFSGQSNTALVAFTIFLGAFLLFQVQLIIGKYILPWFGGGPAVWNTCMLVFQILLLAGYAYAHLITGRLSARWQLRVHWTLLALAGVIFVTLALNWSSPLTPGAAWKP